MKCDKEELVRALEEENVTNFNIYAHEFSWIVIKMSTFYTKNNLKKYHRKKKIFKRTFTFAGS